MEKFETVFRGYNKEQVTKWTDDLIKEYESLLAKSKAISDENQVLKEKLAYFNNIEATLNRAIFAAESAGDEIKKAARTESESIVNEAKRNANRIINDALIKAERAQISADTLKRNVLIYKRRIRSIIESQLEVIEELDNIELKSVDRDDI